MSKSSHHNDTQSGLELNWLLPSLADFVRETDTRAAIIQWLTLVPPPAKVRTGSQLKAWLGWWVAELDERIIEQLNAILHHPRFQALEAAWLGLEKLVKASAGAEKIKLKVLDVSWQDVSKDIDKAIEFDQSQLFQKIYSDEFGLPGGEPYSVILGNFAVSHKPSAGQPFNDIHTLQGLAEIAAASFCPIVLGADPSLLGLESFRALNSTIHLEGIFKESEYIAWNSLRDQLDSRFLCITLPQVLLRPPHVTQLSRFGNIRFVEHSRSADASRHLWGNACFAFGTVLIREFASSGWFSHIHGILQDTETGGLVTEFVPEFFTTESAGLAPKPLTDTLITDRMERLLSELGFMALCQCYDAPFAAFYSNPSLHRPKHYADSTSSLNAKLSSLLQNVLCASRFAHYIKVMVRDKVGAYVRAEECERMLQQWLNRYVSGRDDMDWEAQAQYPLREASVEVRENPAKPGLFWTNIHLKPHYQADRMVSQLKLSTELAQMSTAG